MTAYDFKLRNEHRKIQKCEKLIAKMGAVINDSQYCKPVTLSNISGDLTLSQRLFQPVPIKRKEKKRKVSIALQKEEDPR